MFRIVAIGECMVELSPLDTANVFRLGYAGDTLNTAWYLRRLLGSKGQIDFFTAVGFDLVSDQMLKFLKGSGIGIKQILRRSDKSVGLYKVQLQNGERSFAYWRSDSAARTLADDPSIVLSALEGANYVYFSGITLAILPLDCRASFLNVLRRFRYSGGRVIFDPNLRPSLWSSPQQMTQTVMDAATVSDMVLPSYDDEAQWFGDESPTMTLERYARAEVECCVVKNGADRIFAAKGAERLIGNPVPNVSVVDTTAAGDSFNAGFIAAHLEGSNLHDAVQAGTSLAAQVVAKRGALVDIVFPK